MSIKPNFKITWRRDVTQPLQAAPTPPATAIRAIPTALISAALTPPPSPDPAYQTYCSSFQAAQEMAKKALQFNFCLGSLSPLIADFKNPQFLEKFKAALGPLYFKAACEEIAFAFEKNRNEARGKALLQTHLHQIFWIFVAKIKQDAFLSAGSEVAKIVPKEFHTHLETLLTFIPDVLEPVKENPGIVQKFEEAMGAPLFKQACEQVAFVFTRSRDEQEGKRLLREHRRLILSIAFQAAALEATKHAEEFGKKLESYKSFISDVEDSSKNDAVLFQKFQELTEEGHIRLICQEVAYIFTKQRDEATGMRLLSEDFRRILRVKNYDGVHLLEQVAAFYSFQLENYRGIERLNELGRALILREEAAKNSAGSYGSNNLDVAERVKAAKDIFSSLTTAAKSPLCFRLYELDGGGDKGPDYGLKKIMENIASALCHRGKSPLQDGIRSCTGNTTQLISLVATYLHDVGLQAGDSPAVKKEIKKHQDLENIKQFLKDSFKNNQFITEKLRALHPELRDLLYQIIRFAYFETDPKFGETLLDREPRILLSITSKQGVDLLSQLIAHQKQKIIALRLLASRDKPAAQILDLFNCLSDEAKNELRKRVWEQDGGSANPHINGYREFFGRVGYYGDCKVLADPKTIFYGKPSEYLRAIQTKVEQADKVLLETFSGSKTIPEGPVDVAVSEARLAADPELLRFLPPHFKVAFVTAEFAGVASMGGLAPAVDGMVRGFSVDNSRVIMPLYQGGPIKQELLKSLKEKPKYAVEVDGKKHRVLTIKIIGVRCYFIEDQELFYIPPKEGGLAGNFYEGEFLTVKRRWVVFQSAAAELVYRMSKKQNPVELVHVHDAQTALVPKFLAARHPEEWRQGKTPATLLTLHNNMEQGLYDSDETFPILARHGLHEKANSSIEGIRESDAVTTVSKTFGKEAQTKAFGRGLDPFVKKAALEGKFFGITNGNSNGWDPRVDAQLKSWKSVLEGPSKGQTVDLTFGPDSPDLSTKMPTIQRELCQYLKSRPQHEPDYADLDPTKPIVTYIGRYDSSQKGIDKLELIMKTTIENGGQFVCVGVEPDPKAREILHRMNEYAKARGKKGVLILIDEKIENKYKYQSVFGSMLRAATSVPVFPSKYEPCGLVQGELNRFGKKVVATRTGGFADTLHEIGDAANGYLFQRFEDWDSQDQNTAIVVTLARALNYAKEMQRAFHTGTAAQQKPFVDSMKLIMRNALNSTWEKTPDGSLSPIRRIEFAMAKAFQIRKRRGQQLADLPTLKI